MTLAREVAAFAADIKLAHTVFALPFALLAAVLAAGGPPRAGQVLLILACMFCARTWAMGLNRLLDARLDALNPRTARRAIPAGNLSPRVALALSGACAVGFVAACAGFWLFYANPIPLLASLPVLAYVGAYPLLKRLTALCHVYLGGALALAPVCAWAAVTPALTAVPFLLGLGVLLWTAGFDVVYATQDVASDRATGVHSLPAYAGVAAALWTARALHAGAVASYAAAGVASPALSAVWFASLAVAAVILVAEHALVRPGDVRRADLAFFTFNGVVALVLGTAGVFDALVSPV